MAASKATSVNSAPVTSTTRMTRSPKRSDARHEVAASAGRVSGSKRRTVKDSAKTGTVSRAAVRSAVRAFVEHRSHRGCTVGEAFCEVYGSLGGI
jgi:hypothetical protein